MANRIISIEVGASLTKVCEMDFRAKNPKIYKYFSVQTPEGVYDDGYIDENPAFVNAIKQAIQFHKIRSKQVVCSIMSSKIATREVMIPNVKANQIQALIEANAGDYFPINLSDYEIGYLVLETVTDEEKNSKLKVMVMACHKKLIKCYETLCESLGLHLVSVDYSGNSVYQVIKNEIKEETEMVIRVDEKQSLATVINGSTLAMQRVVPYGIDNAVYALMNNSAFPQKTYEEAFEELSRVTCIRLALNENTVMIEKEDADSLDLVTAKVATAMKEITENLAPLVGNIARVLDLYNSKNPDKPVKRIQLIGMGSEVSGLSKLITNELGLKTIVCETIKNISWNQSAGNGSSGRYATVIGAGLAPIGFINEEKKKADVSKTNYVNLSILIAILGILVAAVLAFNSYGKYQTVLEKKRALEGQINLYSPAQETYNRYNDVLLVHDQIIAADKSVASRNDGLIAFLEELEKTLPVDSEVVEFQSTEEAANITLQLYDIATAAKVLDSIRKFNSLDLVSSTGIEEVEMSIAEYRERLIKLGVISEVTDEEEIQKLEESLQDEDGDIITTHENEDGEEIFVSDKKYKLNITVTYFSNLDDDEEVSAE